MLQHRAILGLSLLVSPAGKRWALVSVLALGDAQTVLGMKALSPLLAQFEVLLLARAQESQQLQSFGDAHEVSSPFVSQPLALGLLSVWVDALAVWELPRPNLVRLYLPWRQSPQ